MCWLGYRKPKEKLDKFTKGYVECALWTENMEDKSLDDFDKESLNKIIEDCKRFQTENADALFEAQQKGQCLSYSGHDFWLTRNHHGAGFWDRHLGDTGEKLTEASKTFFSEVSIFLSEDGKIFCE